MLRPTFFSFETARKSITAAQYGLDTVGHNMSNEHTPGYSRQRVDQVSWAVNSRSRYSVYGKQLPGQGTLVTGINRIRDPFLDNRYRTEATNYGQLAVKTQGLQDINAVFDEIDSTGLHAKFDSLIDAFADLETNFSSSEFKLVVRTEAEQLAQMINKYAVDLNNVETQQASDFGAEIEQMSEILSQIGFLNEKIAQQHIYGNPANELMDDRDLLVDQLAHMTDITVSYEEVIISEDRAIDKLVIQINGLDSPIRLIDGEKYAQFSVAEGKTDPYAVNMVDTWGFERNDVNKLFERGTVKGYLDMLNGKGNFADAANRENSERGIPYFREAFNEFAKYYADTMNWINAGSPVDGSGDPDYTAIADSQKLYSYDPNNAAQTIAITQEWRDNLDHLMTHTPGTDPDDPDNPKYVLKFKEALSLTEHSISNGTVSGSPKTINGTFQEYLVAFYAEMAQDQSMSENMLDASEKTVAGLLDNRDGVSAVSANEESINMMTYQNYYNAALRYMTTLDEALNQIINGMGLVGRG